MFTQSPRLICLLKMILAIIMQNKAINVLGMTVHKICHLTGKVAALW